MLNLLELDTATHYIGIIIFFVLISIALIGFTIWIILRNNKRNQERLSRLNDIDYTQILSSDGGTSGSVTTYDSEGINHGSYSSAPRTKFLVVYYSGEREIVTVNDNSTLCKEYLLKLKKDD